MIRCKCGVWTSYGLTCVNCRTDSYRNMTKPPVEETDEETPVTVVDDDEEELDAVED